MSGNGLRFRTEGDSLHMSVSTQVLVVEPNDRGRDCKPQSFTSTAFAEHERIDANKIAVYIDQRTAAVPWIERASV